MEYLILCFNPGLKNLTDGLAVNGIIHLSILIKYTNIKVILVNYINIFTMDINRINSAPTGPTADKYCSIVSCLYTID